VVLTCAFWNGADPFLKDAWFGLANGEGNHGETCPEYYAYVDALPTHSYTHSTYRYPMERFPYEGMREAARRASRGDPEPSLWDVYGPAKWNAGLYWDIDVTWAKAGQDEMLCRIVARNPSSDARTLHVLPHLFFRNTWAWGYDARRPFVVETGATWDGVQAAGYERHLGRMRYAVHVPAADGVRQVQAAQLLVTDNDTNFERLYGVSNLCGTRHTKDAFHTHVAGDNAAGRVEGVACVKPRGAPGTKAAAWIVVEVDAGAAAEVWVRFACDGGEGGRPGLMSPPPGAAVAGDGGSGGGGVGHMSSSSSTTSTASLHELYSAAAGFDLRASTSYQDRMAANATLAPTTPTSVASSGSGDGGGGGVLNPPASPVGLPSPHLRALAGPTGDDEGDELSSGGGGEWTIASPAVTIMAGAYASSTSLTFADFQDVVRQRQRESDEFWAAVQPASLSADARDVQRRAFANLLQTKRFYHWGVDLWLRGDPAFPAPPASRLCGRNAAWRHYYANDILSVPEPHEYPWPAHWDLCGQ